MAGIKEIEEAISGALTVVAVADRVGKDAWTYSGNSLTVNNPELADVIRRVLANVDKAQIKKEANDLSPLEMIRLGRAIQDALPKALGLIK
jgi:hypothetical protein